MKLKAHLCLVSALLFASASASAQTYTESFEGWDGTTPDWLPEGWTEIHTDDVMASRKDGQYTWHVINPDDSRTLPLASDGRYYAAIGYAKDDNGQDLYQDEWLVSPAFRLSAYGGTLNYDVAFAPLFLFRVGNEYIDWDAYDFIGVRQPAADLQIYVLKLQDDGTWGEYWDMYVSLFADWITQPLASLMSADFSSTRFHTSQSTIFLTDDDLHDATVRIAFRYVGQYGNIMGLDRIRMGYATLVDAPAVEGTETVFVNTVKRDLGTTAPACDLHGRRTTAGARGFHIVPQPDGTVRKVLRP